MNTNAQHTPGPWTAGGSEMTLATWVKGPDGKRICSMRECEHDFHNAKLIAAAPVMYEALQRIAQGVENGQSFSGTDCAEIARAALAEVAA